MGCQESQTHKQEEQIRIRPKEKEAKKTLEAKVVLLGDPNVGKSSIAQRFCKHIFSNQHIFREELLLKYYRLLWAAVKKFFYME